MGNKGSSTNKTQNRKHPHPELSHARFLTKDNQQLIEATFAAASEQEYNKWANSLKEPPASNAKNAFLPATHKAKGSMCGSAKSVTADYPNYPYVLSEEIKKRKSDRSKITEPQIWSLLYDLVTVASTYHQNGMKVGDIQPKNVLLNENGRAAAMTQHSFPGAMTNYIKTLKTEQRTYLAPQEVEDINVGYNETNTKLEPAQAFSIGLTCMDAALLEDSQDLYGSNNKEFNFKELEQKRARLRNHPDLKYQLKSTLLNLTNSSPHERASSTQLTNWLKEHEVQIANQHQFQSYRAPQKIQKAINSMGVSQINNYAGPNNKQISYQSDSRKMQGPMPQSSIHRDTYSGIQQTSSHFVPISSQQYQSLYPSQPQQRPVYASSIPVVPNEPITMRQVYERPYSIQQNNKYFQPSRSPQLGEDFIIKSNHTKEEARRILQGKPPVKIQTRYIQQPSSQYQSYQPPASNINNQNSSQIPSSSTNPRFQDFFESSNNDEKDYNRTSTKTAVVNRGNTHAPQMVSVEVEEDYPERARLTNIHDNQSHNVSSAYGNHGNFSIPEASMEDSTSERIKHSFQNNLSNLSNPQSKSPTQNNFMPQEQSNAYASNSSRLPPRMDSIVSDGSDRGEYKMSFMNTGRSIKDQMKSMSNNQSENESALKSQNIQAPSYYERPSILSSVEDETGGQRTRVMHIRKSPKKDQ